MSEKPKYLVRIYQEKTWWRLLLGDASTCAVLVALFSFGWFFESTAMAWAAFVMAFLYLIGKADSKVKKLTPQEAADFLWTEYQVTPNKGTTGS